mgnify:FL=1|tara:strand:- start:364 stop:564 length:201 start_codon:yes stop_codon:yes gene_type:complete
MKKRNPIARDLMTTKYKSKVIPNKKKHYLSKEDNLLDEDVDDVFLGESDNDLVARLKKETGGSVDE